MPDAPPFAIAPPVEPMLAKIAEELPTGPFLYEPKWDGFRALVFRAGADLLMDEKTSSDDASTLTPTSVSSRRRTASAPFGFGTTAT